VSPTARMAASTFAAVALLGLALPAGAEDDLDFLLNAPAPGEEAETPKEDPNGPRKVAAGLHDGDAFGPMLRPDGKWVAYGVREQVKGTFKTSYYARPLEGDGLFRSIWPNQHPSFQKGEGTASFTDLVGFEWGREGEHSAMVALHKTKREEVLLETMNVRFTGSGAQVQPAIAPDGTRLVVVSDAPDGSGTDLWVADIVDASEPLQLTFTSESETTPRWHPTEAKIIHEQRNPLGGDIWVFDLETFEHKALMRLGTSDEIKPTYSPDGKQFAFLSNKDDPTGERFDLFVATAGDSLPKAVIRGVRRSDKSTGYAWDPLGRFLIAPIEDENTGHPLMIAPVDGSAPPKAFVSTKDNMDPNLIVMGSTARLTWAATDLQRPEDKRYRVVYVLDVDLASLGSK
jgi:Tol biopolymer transport system component